jgi:small multidrug resistance family-3 protein
MAVREAKIMNSILHSILLFGVAGCAEIGGGYLVGLWWRDGKPWPVGLLGAMTLILYGIIPTYQTGALRQGLLGIRRRFRRALRAVGLGVRPVAPDRYDLLGGLLCLTGVAVIMYAPRST